jgi:asparagine N-glycosylation enzyme membrane subunit Stt3
MEILRMRKIAVRSAKPTKEGFLPASVEGEGVWYKREWRLITLLAIMIVAFVIRFIFAYGVSAGSDFALSGGSAASNHASIIESLISGSAADPTLNYPFGSVNIYPPLMDYILAGVAWIVSAFGISAGTAAAGTLAFAAPIFAALTCWPVYLIGRKMFNDEKIGLLAALFYAFFALMIMTTVFSNGTEYAFIGFLFAFMIYFLYSALEDCDKAQPSGFRAMLADKKMIKNLLIAGVLFAMIALSWNQFRILLLMLVFFMAAMAVVDRLRSKEVTPTVGIFSSVILLGVLISAPYYIAAGLWDLIFSGPFIIAIMAVGLAAFFGKTTQKTWVLMIPVTLIFAAAILAALFFVSGDLFTAVVSGNSLYTNPLMAELASVATRTSVSAMASFFGWVTVWMPFAMFLYMFYKYRGNMESRKYAFIMWWFIAMFVIGWYSTSYASIAGAGFAVASAAMVLMLIRSAKLKDYFAEMRGNGMKAALRKAAKPIPLALTIGIVALIAVPNAVYAVDAGTPTNTDGDGYFGGMGYTIMTDDLNSMSRLWSEYRSIDKEGALVTWMGYSTDAASRGGFDTVTDAFGGGSSTMSAVILANSGPAATAAMAIRLMLSTDITQFYMAISNAGLDYNIVKKYIDDPSIAVKEVKDDVVTYSGVNPNITEENALYLVLTNYMTTTTSETSINGLYDKICEMTGNNIAYVAVDRSMLPLYYNDGSYFTTMAFLGSYSLGTYGAPTKYFNYDSNSGYATYTNAMYDTFFWKSLIGMSPAEAGFTSSISFLNALALSDGSVKATPGYGLANYKVAYWHVYYNPDNNATGASDGWEEMDAFEAIKLQNEKGGMINYINGTVVMEYDSSMTTAVSGKVNYATKTGNVGAEGIQVSVFAKTDYDSSGVTEFVKGSTVFTDKNGDYTIAVPASGTYYVVFSSGTNTGTTGSIIETKWSMTSLNSTLNIPATSLKGEVFVTEDPFKAYGEKCYVMMEGKASKKSYQETVTGGDFKFEYVIPDIYSLTVYSPNGTIINSMTVTVNTGNNVGVRLSATSGTLTVTVTDDVGASAPDKTVIVAKDTSTGVEYTGSTVNGQAKIPVVPASYTVFAAGNKVSVTNPTTTVSSNGSSSASLTVYDARNISVSGAPSGGKVSLMSFGFVASTTSGSFVVPLGGGGPTDRYTAYAVNGNDVYYGVSSGNSITVAKAPAAYSVKGIVLKPNGDPFMGTVSFIMDSGATFIFASNEKGEFDVRLPEGKYTMYIFGSNIGASISAVDITENTDLEEIKLSNSRDLTINLTYRTNMSSSTSRGLAFVDITLAMKIDDVEYKIVMKTDSTGKAAFTVPQGYEAVASAKGFDTSRFFMEDQSYTFASGTAAASNPWTLEAAKTDNAKGYVKAVSSVTSSVKVELTLYNSSTVTHKENTSFSNVVPGQYNAVVKGSTGQYFNGTVYIYPGQSGPLKMETLSVATVVIKATEGDNVTVTPTDETAGKYYADTDNESKSTHIYYVERGKSFYFEAVSGKGDEQQIAYASVSNASGTINLNLSNKADKAVIKGYVGVVADGTLTVTYTKDSQTVNIPVAISKGAFEITVPAGTELHLNAKLKQTIGTVEYTYTAYTKMTEEEVVDKANIHFPATTSSTVNSLDLSGSGFKFDNGIGSFTLEVKNAGKYEATFAVTAGSAWVLDKAYTVNVKAGGTERIIISGRYDAALVGAGNANLSVTVTSINGTAVGTYVLDGSAFPASDKPSVYVDIAGVDGASADAVSGYEYMYAVTITNNDRNLKTANISAEVIGSSSKWSLVYSDVNGGMIFPATGTNSFKLNGYDSTVIYIKLMCRDATEKSVPDIEVTVTVPGQRVDTNSLDINEKPPSGSAITFTMKAQKDVEMKLNEASASGDNIYNNASDVPLFTIALVALCAVGLIAMIWFGMRKGVFVRRR